MKTTGDKDKMKPALFVPLVSGSLAPIGRLKDVHVPAKFYSRLSFGDKTLDRAFGTPDMPGVLKGSTVLFTGAPGAGKSTICLQMADLMQRFGGCNVLYNIGEENEAMVKMRA